MLSDLVKANLAGTNAHKPESFKKSCSSRKLTVNKQSAGATRTC